MGRGGAGQLHIIRATWLSSSSDRLLALPSIHEHRHDKPHVLSKLYPFRPSSEDALVNFHTYLYKAKSPVHNNSGSGLLTLPSVELGEAHLQSYHSLRIGKRNTKFSASEKRLKSNIAERICLLPFSNLWEGEKRSQECESHSAYTFVSCGVLPCHFICIGQQCFHVDQSRQETCSRFQSLRPSHQWPTRIVCVSQKDIQQFRDLCSIAGSRWNHRFGI